MITDTNEILLETVFGVYGSSGGTFQFRHVFINKLDSDDVPPVLLSFYVSKLVDEVRGLTSKLAHIRPQSIFRILKHLRLERHEWVHSEDGPF